MIIISEIYCYSTLEYVGLRLKYVSLLYTSLFSGVCDENADKVDGVCVCKVNYTGDGTQCEKLGIIMFT